MLRIFAALLLITTLSACSFLQRHDDEDEAEAPPPSHASAPRNNMVEGEVAKLSSRVEALETRIDVLTSTLEKERVRNSQPVISAEPSSPPTSLAQEVADEPAHAPASPAKEFPTEVAKHTAVAPAVSKETPAVESRFREGMELFQAGKNAEAATRFNSLAQQYPSHALAAHALYWSGEASARSQQWSTAIERWEILESSYPRSAYVPETLAGLSRAYDAQGDHAKASSYKETLLHSFPKAPVTLSFTTHSASENTAAPETGGAEEEEKEEAPSTATQVDE